MNSAKKSLFVNQKIVLLFISFTILTIGCFSVLYGFGKINTHKRHNADEVRNIQSKLLHLKNAIKQVRIGNKEDNRKRLSTEYNDFKNSFRNFYINEVPSAADSLSDSLMAKQKTVPEDHQKALMSISEQLNVLSKKVHFLLYNNLHEDSTYHFIDEQLAFSDQVLTKQEVIKEQKVSVLSSTADRHIKNSQLIIKSILSDLNIVQSHYDKTLTKGEKVFRNIVFIVIIFMCGFIALGYFLMRKFILNPLSAASLQSTKLLAGELDHIYYEKENEIGTLTSTINTLTTDISNATAFVNEIKSGQLENNATLSNVKFRKNPLSSALLELRDELRHLAVQEKQRNWSIEGQAIFAEILSRHNNNFEQLADEIITRIVKYIDARQGMLFVHEDLQASAEEDVPRMILASCYAFDRKKFINKSIAKGEGLSGQVWQEGKTQYLENIPSDHTEIKSGLGKAHPVSLLIVPLKESGQIFGILELALFKPLEQYKIDFVERIAENIASTLSAVENSNRTQLLLEESRQLTEKMRAQEEEMLINLEELQETQEEIKRRELQKDLELKVFAEKYDQEVASHKKAIEDYKSELTQLKKDLEHAKTDNKAIRILRNSNKELEDKIKDLEETVKIKELKVSKLRKKLSDQN